MSAPFHQDLDTLRLGVIGLGYVGLPLAVEFGKQYETRGFDINRERLAQLRAGRDASGEVEPKELAAACRLTYVERSEALADCHVQIVTVPTPIDAHKQPDFGPLKRACRMLGEILRPGMIVVFESTVYPGATEEVCIPLIEEASGLVYNRDFYAGYSPERINPGDRLHRLTTIKKVTSGSTPEVAQFVDRLYASIIPAGTHLVSSIRVAEAAKVIENTQRDLNIALINELAIIFNRLGLDTQEVLEAAGTKWNFLPFRPGLVGGHCIGVDPYYLTYKAQAVGHHPEVILAGRRVNDGMGIYVAQQVIKLMAQRDRLHPGARVLILGLTFKENCPDLRNTRVIDIVQELCAYKLTCDVYDPLADPAEAEREYGLALLSEPQAGVYDAIVLAVAHRQFADWGPERIRALGRPGAILYDVKHLLLRTEVDGRL
ncbi:nucleotide sugar dehydrogenase [Caldichromatium japonicum]|uniref:Nucleotide sugar dehydrogenase n=1 Tax=Caldichromatium japonicum TaxID=2699430 RepID=A0A6G7VE62_9GAMM|nr:nucleotide sugar dehydrogenase [Caldichromatium japonicum]QIK38242.1 nucleotide sugar dehydrogenase [Caldichromatium japonicum]